MKKIILGIVFGIVSLMAADGRALASKCAACHGAEFEKMALGKSAVVNGQSASDIYAKLVAYKEGRRNATGMGALMKGQMASMSNNDIWAIATYIASLSTSSAVEAAPANDWPYACESSELNFARDDRYFRIAGSESAPWIAADQQTIQIDRKNKTIKVWTIWLASEQGKQIRIENMGKYNDYSSYGYSKTLDVINYQNMKLSLKSNVHYNCNGSIVISNSYNDNQWDDIVPGSLMEAAVHALIKKYNLK